MRRLALDGLNFFLADAASLVGPYLGIYLLTRHNWDQASIGLVTMICGLTGMAIRVPTGALIDATHRKRGLLIAALAMLSVAATAIATEASLPVVIAAGVAISVSRAAFGPSVAALTLGLFARPCVAARLGRNGAFDHGGNVFAALVAGVVGSLLSQQAVFLLVPLFSLFAASCVLGIRSSDIDHERARGAEASDEEGCRRC
jgi:predicted MFS family arabinose efflux permease